MVVPTRKPQVRLTHSLSKHDNTSLFGKAYKILRLLSIYLGVCRVTLSGGVSRNLSLCPAKYIINYLYLSVFHLDHSKKSRAFLLLRCRPIPLLYLWSLLNNTVFLVVYTNPKVHLNVSTNIMTPIYSLIWHKGIYWRISTVVLYYSFTLVTEYFSSE